MKPVCVLLAALALTPAIAALAAEGDSPFVSPDTRPSEVLRREPRHFGAMSGLGMILQEFGDDKHALEVFRRALAVHPHLQKIPDMVKSLTETVEGRDI